MEGGALSFEILLVVVDELLGGHGVALVLLRDKDGDGDGSVAEVDQVGDGGIGFDLPARGNDDGELAVGTGIGGLRWSGERKERDEDQREASACGHGGTPEGFRYTLYIALNAGGTPHKIWMKESFRMCVASRGGWKSSTYS